MDNIWQANKYIPTTGKFEYHAKLQSALFTMYYSIYLFSSKLRQLQDKLHNMPVYIPLIVL